MATSRSPGVRALHVENVPLCRWQGMHRTAVPSCLDTIVADIAKQAEDETASD